MASDLISRAAAIGCLGNSPSQMCMPWSEVEKMLCELPTVDAIPVEWLKQQFYDNPNLQWAEKCRDVFTGWQKWQRLQKEQEAQNGNM